MAHRKKKFLNLLKSTALVIISLLAFTAGTDYSLSQDNTAEMPSTNYDEFVNTTLKSFAKTEDRITALGKEKIYFFKINAGKEEKEFFVPLFKTGFWQYRILYAEDDTLDYVISIDRVALRTFYPEIISKQVLGDKKAKRKITVSYDLSVFDKNNNLIYKDAVFEKSEGVFPLDYYEYVESGKYSFLKGDLPDESIFKKLLIPGIIVVSSAAAIVLFFTVRSK